MWWKWCSETSKASTWVSWNTCHGEVSHPIRNTSTMRQPCCEKSKESGEAAENETSCGEKDGRGRERARQRNRHTETERQRHREWPRTSRHVSEDTILEVSPPAHQPSISQVHPAEPFSSSWLTKIMTKIKWLFKQLSFEIACYIALDNCNISHVLSL